ncbi:ABC transporter substrate-binding protein [Balneolaceae bacterium YR4-1]|uniref:ABC transporter substrate-binding protein n=1 Tax=Halalkalibaculum roseum TaxID=2709311 RepID=A0A6M1SJ76_9BACT|nr:ABC transporter substrate-binding protein [Halalkalibaculum roseum]NGP75371.1 ABC transporter substrate-binding protein [Halalkalibaculum roseum]
MMKQKSLARLSLLFLFAIVLVTGCKGPETTVVRQNPIAAAPDTSETTDTTASEPSAAFRQINIGEINPIPTMDPLFAENAGTMRALQLVYEGLVRFDRQGDVVPGIATNWTVTDDSLQYTFTLRNNVYYHDNNAFNNGIGRKFKASDVKFAFNRMAMNSVPDHAAQLFMSVEGFEPFYREQHNIFNPGKRVLNGVTGVRTPNDTTVVFRLEEKDSHLLQKLASPYALIYPREAITNNNPDQFKAVGTGPFTLSQNRGDSLYTFARFNDYYNPEQPRVNRVDVIVKKREANLFKSFTTRNIHIIPELGLQMLQGVLDENGALKASYADSYRLSNPNGYTFYSLNRNSNAGLSREKSAGVTALFDSTETFENIPSGFVRFMKPMNRENNQNNVQARVSEGDTLNITNTDDSYSLQFLVKLRNKLNEAGATLRVYNIFTPTRNIGLYTTHNLPFYSGYIPEYSEDRLLSFRVHQKALSQNEIENLYFNSFPWWLDMRTVTTSLVP